MTLEPRQPEKQRLPGLDVLRFIAAAMVVMFHYLYRGAVGDNPSIKLLVPDLAPVAMYGYLGIHLFFMISGFVIAMSLTGRNSYTFLRARALRLLPAFWLCMAITAVVTALWGSPHYPIQASQLPFNLLFAGEFDLHSYRAWIDGVYWTLRIEWIFYLMTAAALVLGLLPRHPLLLVAAWLAAITALAAGGGLLPTIVLKAGNALLIAKYAPYFMVGILTAHLLQHQKDLRAYALLFGAVVMGAYQLDLHAQQSMLTLGQLVVSVPVVMALYAAVTVLFALACGLRKLPCMRLCFVLGGLTYPLYLLHARIGYIFLQTWQDTLSGPTLVTLATIASLAASYGVWKYLEPRGKAWLAKLLPTQLAAPRRSR